MQGHVVEVGGDIAAAILRFLSFSSKDGTTGSYAEAMFVRPKFRRRGLGRALYEKIGALPQLESTAYRLSGPPLVELAGPR